MYSTAQHSRTLVEDMFESGKVSIVIVIIYLFMLESFVFRFSSLLDLTCLLDLIDGFDLTCLFAYSTRVLNLKRLLVAFSNTFHFFFFFFFSQILKQ